MRSSVPRTYSQSLIGKGTSQLPSKQLRVTVDGAYLRFCAAAQKRKGIDSLAQLCRDKLDSDPFSGCLFFFRSRSAKSILVLAYDGQGLCKPSTENPRNLF